MGAVASTFISGVLAIKKGLAKPIGSMTQMGTIMRLGKRTENRVPLIKDFVPLAKLEDLVFTGWDINQENLLILALGMESLKKAFLNHLKTDLEKINVLKAVFDKNFVRRLSGEVGLKTGKNKWI